MTAERWEQVGKLYEVVSELAPGERAPYLSQACGGDAELRREVESLLAAEESVGDFIAAPALKDAANLLSTQAPGLLLGKQLGHYQILSFIGAGGMGEVYAARDTRLGRRVALKLLPAIVARDADRLRRFEQEARAIGMLNHPNILTIHDIGTYEGAPYIVSELLEGQTLRELFKTEPLSPRKAIDFALQTARGLAAAHERGVVHRDLKPENLFITHDQRVKILDFGLAKLTENRNGALGLAKNTDELPAAAAFVLSSAGTRLPQSTAPGLVMGTVGYMAPEQVRGDEADHRADIFAFGVILYELFAGQRPFKGDTAVETLNAILKTEPPALPDALRQQAPGLERIIYRCLEKRPEQRFQSASDLGFALEALTSVPGTSGVRSGWQGWSNSAWSEAQTATLPQSWWQRLRTSRLPGWLAWAGWLLATGLGVLLAMLAWGYFHPPAAELEAIRLAVTPPEKAVRMSDPSVSPDGRRLAFVANLENSRSMLWIRPLGSLTAQQLAGTEGANSPFWAPDGQSIGFFASGKLKKIALSGEPPVALCDAPSHRGGAWSTDGSILFVPHPNAGVQRISANGGSITPVTTPDSTRQESNHLWPALLPDGKNFIYLVTSQQTEETGIYLSALDGRTRRRLLAASSNAFYAAPGYLVFAREGGLLLAQAFNLASLQVSGEPLRLAEQIPLSPFGKAGFSVSANGVLVHSPSASLNNQQPHWFDRTGKDLGAIGSTGPFGSAELSPDESRLVLTRTDRQTRMADIWVLDLAAGSDLRITFDPANDIAPLWSPDGKRLVWLSSREGATSFYQKPSDGSGQAELLYRSDHQVRPIDWSPDGRFLTFQDNDPKTKWDVKVLPLDGTHQPQVFAQTPSNEYGGRFSPDGRWLAYTSDESGTTEVYVQAFQPNEQSAGNKWQISTTGGDGAKWRADGKELFFVSGGKLMSVEVNSGAGFQYSAPKELFDLRSIRLASGGYSVSRDGKRFLLLTSIEEQYALPFTIVLNWPAALSQ